VHTKRPHYVPKTYLGARANSALLLGASAVTVRLQKIEKNSFRRSKRSGLAYARSDDARRPARRTSVPAVGVRSNSVCQTLKHCQQTNFLHNVAVTTDERPIPKPAVRQYLTTWMGSSRTMLR